MTDQPQKFDFKAALRLTGQGRLKEVAAMLKSSSPALLRKLTTGFVPPPAAPETDTSFTTHRFTGTAGSRDYFLYVPANRRGPMPLVMMLHGCGQTPEEFATATRMNALAEQHGFFVVYPAQRQMANMSRCWNWFRPIDQMRGMGEPSLLAGIVAEISAAHPVEPTKIYLAGLSAGGAMAVALAALYPETFAAVGVHSGLPFGVAKDAASAMAVMRQGAPEAFIQPGRITVPMILFQGTADEVVNPLNAARIMMQSSAAALPETTEQGSENGLAFTRKQFRDAGSVMLEEWLIEGAGHAWCGGDPAGSYAEPRGPDASREMLRFFLQHRAVAI